MVVPAFTFSLIRLTKKKKCYHNLDGEHYYIRGDVKIPQSLSQHLTSHCLLGYISQPHFTKAQAVVGHVRVKTY